MTPDAIGHLAAPSQWSQHGITGVIAFIFLVGVIALFKMYVSRIDRADETHRKLNEEHIRERGEWTRQMAEMRADYEIKHRQVADQYAAELRKHYEDNREHEDAVRKAYSDNLNAIAGDYTQSLAQITRVLDKLYERFVGPRARGRKE